MNIEDIDLKQVMYFLDTFTISLDSGVEFNVPRIMISKFSVVKNYYTEILPYYYISVNVPLWLYSKLVLEPDGINVALILKYTTGRDNVLLTAPDSVFTTEIQGKFKARIAATTQVTDYEIQTSISKESGSYETNYEFNEFAFLELLVYNPDALNMLKNNSTAVISKSSLLDAVSYCLTKANMKNILVDPPDNTEQLSEIKLVKGTYAGNLLRLVDGYELYTDGAIVFFDLNESFILSRKPGCRSWRDNEFKTTHLISLNPTMGNNMSRFNGIYSNVDEMYHMMSVERESFSTDDLDDIGYASEGTNQLSFLTINAGNATMEMLSPNKEFIVNVDTPEAKDMNGTYRMYSYQIEFTPNGDLMQPFFIIRLCRSKPDTSNTDTGPDPSTVTPFGIMN